MVADGEHRTVALTYKAMSTTMFRSILDSRLSLISLALAMSNTAVPNYTSDQLELRCQSRTLGR
jgi:hypothetical protein